MSIGSRLRSSACLAVAGVAVASVAGCGGNSSSSPDGARVVKVAERDFRILAPKSLRAGNVVFQVHNRGPDDHELIVVRAADGRLPLRGDGLTVDEEALERVEAGALEPGLPDSVRELKLHLTPGRYVLLCNMSGHYFGGMHSMLVVS